MGLTVAEIFIILVFGLLLLLLLLQIDYSEHDEDLAKRNNSITEHQATIEQLTLAKNTLQEDLAKRNNSITEHQATIEQLTLAKNTLQEDLAKRNNSITEHQATIEQLTLAKNTLQEDLAKRNNSITEHQATIEQLTLAKNTLQEDLAKRNNLITEHQATIEQLALAKNTLLEELQTIRESLPAPENINILANLSNLKPNEKKLLKEFMARKNLQERLAKSLKFEEFLTDATNEDIVEQLIEMDPNTIKQLNEWMMAAPEELLNTLNRREEVSKILKTEYNLSQVLDQLESNTLISTEVAIKISQEVGEIVREFGGEIGPDKVINIPSERGFPSGSAILTKDFQDFLGKFCPKLVNVLAQNPKNIEDIRVEGHASSEWKKSSSTQDRYLKNLDLSQRRAYAVLSYCLEVLREYPLLFDWAIKKITAVGYSSSRPILNEAQNEDKDKSRRVVFSYIVNYN